MTPLTVAYCCTIHNEEDIVYWQLFYYYRVGIRDFFIQFNTADDLTRPLVAAFQVNHPDANLHIFINPDRDYERFPLRKMRMYRKAGEAGFDWILPLDADELITTQDSALRAGFNLPDFLNTHYGYLEPNQHIRFPAYMYTPRLDDDWFESNPFTRIRYRQSRWVAKTIWRYGEEGTVFRGAHLINNSTRPRKQGPKPMTAHFPHRSPIQVTKKFAAFSQCATHQYTGVPNLDRMPSPDYSAHVGTLTGEDIEGSVRHQEGKASRGRSYLLNPNEATQLLKHQSTQATILDPVWEDTFHAV